MKLESSILQITLFLFIAFTSCKPQSETTNDLKEDPIKKHPFLILTTKSVQEIQSQLGQVPLFDHSLARIKAEVDNEIKLGVRVPIPKDLAGGYTHQQHTKNYITLQKAGVLYQILEEEKYAKYIKEVLMVYAKLYPTLPIHPKSKSYAPGKIFWQNLNDANWLVSVSQAYDCIYDYLNENEKKTLETDLFTPFANYLSIESPQFFDRVHNHSTWGNVAVGMIGLIMNDSILVNRALHGLESDSVEVGTKDNDGGFIRVEGQKSGFFANLDEPFSPDGYYTEGPYYQRYAMYPFMLFAEALENARPELKIFEYKNGVLLKAVEAILHLTTKNGEFFPLNDAQKGMSIYSNSLVSAVDIAYFYGGQNPALLDVAKDQNEVQLDQTGLAVALAIRDGKEKAFTKKSIEFTDGFDGKQGGIGILRIHVQKDELTLVMKYTAQGLSHGHYDKLSFSLYRNEFEVIQDYGFARFVNIVQKNGGGYLKENSTWAKQSIAHNTLVQNENSHFGGNYDIASKHHSEKYVFDASNPECQIVSAKETNAYPGTTFHRTMAFITDKKTQNAFVLDILKVKSDHPNQYDLPFYYLGQVIDANFDYEIPKTLSPLGKSNGFQHLWMEGKGISDGKTTQLTWRSENTFYTLSSVTDSGDQLIFGRIGADDPEFNLRRDPTFILRKTKAQNALFVSTIEMHGNYSVVSELAKNTYSSIEKIEILYDDDFYTALNIKQIKEINTVFILSNKNNSKDRKHQLNIAGKSYEWTGPYFYKSNK